MNVLMCGALPVGGRRGRLAFLRLLLSAAKHQPQKQQQQHGRGGGGGDQDGITHLEDLDIGDLFTLQIMDETLTYEVDRFNRVLPHELISGMSI